MESRCSWLVDKQARWYVDRHVDARKCMDTYQVSLGGVGSGGCMKTAWGRLNPRLAYLGTLVPWLASWGLHIPAQLPMC